MSDEARDKIVGYSYGINFDLGNNRGIQVNGSLLMEDDVPTMNGKIDRIMQVLERQRARAEMPTLEAELAQRRRARQQILEQITAHEAKLHAAGRSKTLVPKQDIANLEHLRVNLVKVDLDIEEANEAIAARKKQAA